MQSHSVTRLLLTRAIAVYFVLSLAILLACATKATASNPITINFDDQFYAGTIITNQYPGAQFSSSYDYNVRISNAKYRSAPNSIISSNINNAWGPINVYFPIPVNNLSFYVLNVYQSYYTAFSVDIYQNGYYYNTYYFTGYGTPNIPLLINLSSIPNITGIYIYQYQTNANLFFDDFTFTPNLDVKISSARVSGFINGTTQNALLGADVALQANIVPSNLTGGTFSWSATGPSQQVSATNTGSSYTVRWTEPGTYQATVTYTRNGVTASSSVNINVVLPSLTSFTATQAADTVTANQCGGDLPPPPTAVYVLGCPPSPYGMVFSATAQIPAGSYLTDPAQSGIKYVQLVSVLRKDLSFGKVQCQTARSPESNTESGWQLDGADPYRTTSVVRFSQGNTLTTQDNDSPRVALATPYFVYDSDAYYVNDYFETYVVYFTGSNPTAPIFQRAIGLQNSPKPVARIAWSWGGQVVYDPASPYSYQKQFTLVPPTSYVGQAVDFMRAYSGNANDLTPAQCPSGPPVSNNPIDSSRFFVRQQYCDILNRPPDGSWIYWIREITLCAFDQTCINNRRIAVVRGFYESPEFRQSHPALQNPGSPEYNEEYVRQLYRTLLHRDPDAAYHAWVDMLNQTGDYNGVVGGFINSPEYRARSFVQCY